MQVLLMIVTDKYSYNVNVMQHICDMDNTSGGG